MFVNDYKKDRRLESCMGCKHFRNKFKILGIALFKKTPQGEICKCSIDLKIISSNSKCPKNKW